MASIDDYVARIEGTCGAEKDILSSSTKKG
jgi:hypothetical protein